MASKKRKVHQQMDFDPYDDYEDFYDEEMDISDIAKDFYSTDWESDFKSNRSMTARRKIERRRDMKRLWSELQDFEEFGEQADW
jgi:hypothetical protein